MQRGRLPLVLLGCLTLALYFAYHAVYGTHGLQARQRLIERAGMLERDVARLEAIRVRLRRDVSLLAPDAPDSDMVQTIAVDILGYARGDALVIERRHD